MATPEQQAIFDAVSVLGACMPDEYRPIALQNLVVENMEVDAADAKGWFLYSHKSIFRAAETYDARRGCQVRLVDSWSVVESKYETAGLLQGHHQVSLDWQDDDKTVFICPENDMIQIVAPGEARQDDRFMVFEASRSPAWRARIVAALSFLIDSQLELA